MNKTQNSKISDKLLIFAAVLLGISIPFSIVLVNVSFALLVIVLSIKIINKEISWIRTGLEIPLLVFLTAYFVSALVNPGGIENIKDVTDNYWYILFLYLVVYLFKENEIKRFTKALIWSAVAAAIFTILQSLAGLEMILQFNLNETVEMLSTKVEKVTEISGWPVYMGTGVMGHHLTFGGQMLMLSFLSWAVFKKKRAFGLVASALFLSFAFSCWFGFVAAVFFFYAYRKKACKPAAAILIIFALLLVLVPGSRRKLQYKLADRILIWKTSLKIYSMRPLTGVGPGKYTSFFEKKYGDNEEFSTGAKCHPHSIYLDMLTEGGALTFFAFLFLMGSFVKIYGPTPKGQWAQLYTSGKLALLAVFFAGIFQTYLTDAENSVLIWTVAGLMVKMKMLSSGIGKQDNDFVEEKENL